MGQHVVGPVSKPVQAILDRLARVTAHLPEVSVERDGFGHSVLKAGKRSFVIVGDGHGEGEGPGLSIKTDPVTQDLLVRGGDFERTPYIGQHGWVTARGRAATLPWKKIEGLVEDAWRAVAPKRLVKKLDQK
jgi:hypothetical protein